MTAQPNEMDSIVNQIDNFGKDTAEREITNNYLIQYFIQNEPFKRAADGSKSIIIGRRGSGKSAIFLFLKQNQDKFDHIKMAFVIPDKLSAKKMQEFVGKGITEQSSKVLAWKYIFLVLIAKFVVNMAASRGDEKSWPENVRKIRKFLVENEETEDITTIERMSKLASKIQSGDISIKFSPLELGIKKKEENNGFALADSISRLQQFLIEILGTAPLSKMSFHIYIDEVDNIWEDALPEQVMTSKQLIIGLIQAANEINITFSSVRCICFLRTDIYQILDFQEKAKLHGEELEIKWDKDGLIDLMYERTRQCINIDKDSFIGKIFDGAVEEMNCLDYMISRTLMRPRDLIQFCNLSLDKAKASKHCQIDAVDVLNSELEYSKWRVADLVSEYKSNYQFLNDIIITFAKEIGFTKPKLNRKFFLDKYNSQKMNLASRHAELSNFTPEILLAILYNIGFIGTIRSGVTVYKHTDPNTVSEFDNEFTIHPAFWKYLNITLEENGIQKESPTVPDKAEEPQNLGSTKSASIISGVDEVEPNRERTDFQEIASKIENVHAEIGHLIMYIDSGKAILVRTIALLNQSTKELRQLDTIIREYSLDDEEVGERFDLQLARICRMIEDSIETVETRTSNMLGLEMDQISRRLVDLLSDFYNILINKYNFDVLTLSDRKKE